MFQLYLIIIITSIILWRILFSGSKTMERRLRKKATKQSTLYDRVDKRTSHQEYVMVKSDMETYKKYRIVSDSTLKQAKVSLRTLGIHDVEGYFHARIKEGVSNLIIGLGVLAMGIVFNIVFIKLIRAPLGGFVLMLNVISIYYLIKAFLGIFSINKIIAEDLKKHVRKVEEDFNKLFFHLYPYYNSLDNHYRMSDVLSKFQTDNPQMKILVNTLVADSKTSEEGALSQVIVNYSTSLKVVDLASKLIKCVTGNKLGPEYLKSMYDQLIAEEDRQRLASEEKKNNLYMFILTIAMIGASLAQLIGIMASTQL